MHQFKYAGLEANSENGILICLLSYPCSSKLKRHMVVDLDSLIRYT